MQQYILTILKNNIKILLFFIFIIALSVRLIFIFFIYDPNYAGLGPYDDTYDRWSIAYLSEEIGFHEGLFKLTSFTWNPYFWGLMHPLLTITAFMLSGSTDLAVMRVMTAILGSVTVVLIYLLCYRYWNFKVAIASVLFSALNPVGILNDSSGLAETIGIFFILSAIYFWSKKSALSGICLAFAFMTRAENWLLSSLMIGAFIVFSKIEIKNKIHLSAGYFLPIGLYFIYLYKYTGKFFYPFYVNTEINIIQGGMTRLSLISTDIASRFVFIGMTILGLIATIYTIKRKPKGFYLLLFGSFYLTYLGIVFGISNYSYSIAPQIWHSRYVLFLFIFGGICLSMFLFYLKLRVKLFNIKLKIKHPWYLLYSVLFTSQFLWLSTLKIYRNDKHIWNYYMEVSKDISEVYHGGNVVVTESSYPIFQYALYKYAGINGRNLISDNSDPFFIMKKDPYENFDSYKLEFLEWTRKNEIKKIISFTKYAGRYNKLVSVLPSNLTGPVYIGSNNLVVYDVK